MRFIPGRGDFGDPVPFYHEGAFHLFFLRRLPDAEGPEGCPWGHAVSRDLLHWDELPDALVPGVGAAPDSGGCWTGSVIARDGMFHAFYTGFAPTDRARPQTVCHAASRDLVHWEKDARNPILLPDTRWYEASDWRDPYVFWHPGERRYWMLITARQRRPNTAPRRGCIAVASSPDLETWEVRGPLWAPLHVHALECPDLWKDRDVWHLLYSNGTTRAREAVSTEGPWRPTGKEEVDGRWFYAAKCFHVPTGAGERHVMVGWIPSRKNAADAGEPQWGGAMGLPREASQSEYRELAWRVAEEVQNAWSQPLPELRLIPATGRWRRVAAGRRVEAGDGLALALAHGVPPSFRLEMYLTLGSEGEPATFHHVSAGVVLRLNSEGDAGYVVALDARRQVVEVRPWRRWGDAAALCSQPVRLVQGRPVHLDLYLDGSLLELFVDDQVVLSARCYDHSAGSLGFWAQDGTVLFSDPWLYGRP